MLLQARGLTKHFGGLHAVENVDFDIERGEIHALIGPNGAGKTTLVSLLCGRLQATAGTIRFDGRDITRLPAHVRVGLGIAYTFQITSVFERLSVFDNVALAVQHEQDRNRREHNLRSDTMRALERVGLDHLSAQTAGSLSYGHQRLLEIAMGLAAVRVAAEPVTGFAWIFPWRDARLVAVVALVIGCSASYGSNRLPKSALVAIEAAGHDITVLGDKEQCCGFPLFRMGTNPLPRT